MRILIAVVVRGHRAGVGTRAEFTLDATQEQLADALGLRGEELLGAGNRI